MNKENFFDENVYNYLKKNQTNRIFFYIKTLIILGVMVANELDFVYNSFQFTVIVNETKYTFETCIEYEIPKCIPELYTTTSNETLSFSVPIFLSKYSVLAQYFSYDIYFIYALVVIFLAIMSYFFYEERNLYVFRSRAHELLSIFVVLLYSFLKYLMISGFEKDVSIIECNQIPIALFFEGKSQSSLYGIVFNLVLFLFIFKDPIFEIYNNINKYYEELTLTKFIESKNSANSLERMKLLKYCTPETINKAVSKFVVKNYPYGTISKYERRRRNNVFKYLKTTMVDFIPAVMEYYQENPHLFTHVIPNQIDFESNGNDNYENENLIN
ncbi:hypothetical protein ACTFIZ_008130 [Dictyostelium cf. discoideum]